MKRFLYIAEGGRLNYLDCTSAEMVYRCVCCFYMPSTKVVVIDTETNEDPLPRQDNIKVSIMVKDTKLMSKNNGSGANSAVIFMSAVKRRCGPRWKLPGSST